MPYGGYAGFEEEHIRQSSLKGRKFREADKNARLLYFHQNNIRNDNIPVTPALPPPSFTLAPIAAQGRRRAAIGEAAPEAQFNPITGANNYPLPSPYIQSPHLNHFPSLGPNNPPEANVSSMLGAPHASPHVSPTKKCAGRGSTKDTEYSRASLAMRHTDTVKEHLKPSALEHRSFQELKNERTHHARSLFGPEDRYLIPLTSSQAYGWNQPQQTSGNRLNYFGNRLCKETRLAQSLIIGARNAGGYVGQGCL